MSILQRAISRGVNRAVGKAVENAVERKANDILAPKVNQAADAMTQNMNNAANAQYNAAQANAYNAGQTNAQLNSSASQLGSALGAWAGAVNTFANEAAKNMKICPSCGEGASSDKKFCPNCGSKLPEQTVAQGAVCTSCGKQNGVGQKFCSGCGSKLPAAIAEEEAARAKLAAALQEWDALLPQYPRWCYNAKSIEIENTGNDEYGRPCYQVYISGTSPAALEQYKQLLMQNGFRMAGQYPTMGALYKMLNGVCYCFYSEDAFSGDPDYMTAGFMIREPIGGYNYVKPEPKKKSGLFDFFK